MMNMANVAVVPALWIIVSAAIMSGLILGIGHWFPWEAWLKRRLPRLLSYGYGLVAVLVPASLVMAIYEQWIALAAVWGCAVVGGLTVVGGYGLDSFVGAMNERRVAQEEGRLLRGQVYEGRE
ncbi:MAG: hypothetical protein HPY85_06725 [Anaerolineae bacterium]|nr:hypothetical protein [Anaerolineae bacterium]